MCAEAYTNDVPRQCCGREAAGERCMTQSRSFPFRAVCKDVRVEASMRAVHQPHGCRTVHCCKWQLQSQRFPLSVEAFMPKQVKLRGHRPVSQFHGALVSTGEIMYMMHNFPLGRQWSC